MKMRAYKTEKGNFLVEIEKGAKYAFVSKDGNLLRWSSFREWLYFGRLIPTPRETSFKGKIKIPIIKKSVFTLWCGSGWDPEPAENMEVTLWDIIESPVGATFENNESNVARDRRSDRLTIEKKTSKVAIVRLWERVDPDHLESESYNTKGQLFKVFLDTGKVVFLKDLDKEEAA